MSNLRDTIFRLLNAIPDRDVRAKALHNITEHPHTSNTLDGREFAFPNGANEDELTIGNAIDAFWWEDTSEGSEYWHDQYHRYMWDTISDNDGNELI